MSNREAEKYYEYLKDLQRRIETLERFGGGGGGASPLTTKGDLYTYSTEDARLPVGSDGQLLTADSTEATGLKWSYPQQNRLINGNFDIWQRGLNSNLSSGLLQFTSTGYTADRWHFTRTNATLSQIDSGLPNNSVFGARITLIGSGGSGQLTQAFEESDCTFMKGRDMTLSLLLKKSPGFTDGVDIKIQKNSTANTQTGGSWSDIESKTISGGDISDSEWNKFSLTATIPDDSTANGIRVLIVNQTAQSSGYFEISQVQFSEGVTHFIPRRYYSELLLCQRYYYRPFYQEQIPDGNIIWFGNLIGTGNSTGYWNVHFPCEMRTTPDIDSNSLHVLVEHNNRGVSNVSYWGNPQTGIVNVTISGGNTVTNNRNYFRTRNTASNTLLAFDAEL